MSGADSAFPCFGGDGLTKREYFAAMAMQGICAHDASPTYASGPCNSVIADRAAALADALIAALNAEPQQ